MTVIANLTVAVDKSDRFIKIVLDNGKIGVRHIKAFDVVEK